MKGNPFMIRGKMIGLGLLVPLLIIVLYAALLQRGAPSAATAIWSRAASPSPTSGPGMSSRGASSIPLSRPAEPSAGGPLTTKVAAPAPAPRRSVTLDPTTEPVAPLAPSPDAPPDVRPNIVLIISDDQRFDTMDYMPRTKERLFDQGITFSRAYVTTPWCCPSRASLFTGQYAHTHGVFTNWYLPSGDLSERTFPEPTWPERLHEEGYYTGLVGKWLNSWHPGRPRPEFDQWMGGGYVYEDPTINVNGRWAAHEGYLTDIQSEYAVSFIEEAAAGPQPFLLLFAPFSPHAPAIPAPQDVALYSDVAPHRPPSFNEQELDDQLLWRAEPPPLLTDLQVENIDAYRLLQLRSLNALDRGIEAILDALDAAGEAENTIVVYLSDNGLMWGEHRIYLQKVVPYEESIHVPLAIRFPRLNLAPRTDDHLVANIDLGPTLLELLDLPIPASMDGRSLLPLLTDEGTPWRDAIVLAGWDATFEEAYLGLHTGRYVLIEWETEEPGRYIEEFYDLANDPYQLTNRATDEAYSAIRDALRAQLHAERDGMEPQVRIVGPTEAKVGEEVGFHVTLYPSDPAEPITFEWEVTGDARLRQEGAAGESIAVAWEKADQYWLTVTARQGKGVARGTRVILIHPKDP